jgi:hypothetical protein
MMLASQLPEDIREAKLVVQAVRELLDTFMLEEPSKAVDRAKNVLPFTAG